MSHRLPFDRSVNRSEASLSIMVSAAGWKVGRPARPIRGGRDAGVSGV